ncbi:MAG: helix-turn-helix domain-containing protein [Nitrosomonadales bacterium]|nr:helix-turn-helix domain-containing protein [Nitrosomonadales bacterium]
MTDSQPDGSIEEPPFSAGAALREARARLGLSVADVAHRLKFAPRQVEALEADDFARLPEITFVRGFVRSYARLLQLDPAPLLAALPGAPVPPPPLAARALEEISFSSLSPTRKPNLAWLIAATLIVALAAGFFVWMRGDKPGAPPKTPKAMLAEKPPAPVQPPASAVPGLATVAAVTAQLQVSAHSAPPAAATLPQSAVPAAAPRRPGTIRMEFDEESWVEVTDREGRILLSQVFPRGSEQSLNGKPPFSLVIGRSSAVRLTYKGKAVDLAPHAKAGVARLTLE